MDPREVEDLDLGRMQAGIKELQRRAFLRKELEDIKGRTERILAEKTRQREERGAWTDEQKRINIEGALGKGHMGRPGRGRGGRRRGGQ